MEITDFDDLLRAIDALDDTKKCVIKKHLEQSNTTNSPKRIAGLHSHLGSAVLSDNFDDPLLFVNVSR